MWNSEEIIKTTTKRIDKAFDRAEKSFENVEKQIDKTFQRAEKAVKECAEEYFGENSSDDCCKKDTYEFDMGVKEPPMMKADSSSPTEIRIVMKTFDYSTQFANEVNAALKEGFNFVMGTSDIRFKNLNGQDYLYVLLKK